MRTLFCIVAIVLTLCLALPQGVRAQNQSENPAIISARVIEHKTDVDVFVADGNVVIEQGNIRLVADHAVLDNRTGQVKAEGSITYTDRDGNTIFTDKVDFNVNTERGILHNGRFHLKSKQPHRDPLTVPVTDRWKDFEEMRLTGDMIEKTGEFDYEVDKGTFTTCTADVPPWKISGTDIQLTIDEEVTAKNATFYLRNIPVLYLPYMSYPLERRTGFLTPTVGINSREGFKMYNRFFWAISDNQDATFGVDYRALKGVELGLDYRYVLDSESRGELKNRYLYDWDEERNRYTLDYQITHRFTPSLTGKADFKYQRENNYYREFSDSTADRIQWYTESNVFLTQSWTNSTLVGLIQYKDDLTMSNTTTLQRLPEVRYTINRSRIADTPWFYYLDSTATRFYREEGIDGERLDLYPRVAADYDLGYGFILSPRFGFRETFYSRKASDNEFTTREVLTAGASLSVKLAKIYQMGGLWGVEAIRHQIEPAIDYDHVPYIHHQRKLPSFDGVDRISERDHLTYSLTNRLIGKFRQGDESIKKELMVFTLSQSFDVEEAKRKERGTNRRPFGTVAGDLSLWLGDRIALRHKATYDPDAGNMTHFDTDVSVNSGGPWYLVVGHRYTRQSAINFIKASAGYRISRSWDIAGNVWYDSEENKVREQDFTLSYSGQCWGISFRYVEKAGEDAPDIQRKRETQYLFTVDFKGLTSVGF